MVQKNRRFAAASKWVLIHLAGTLLSLPLVVSGQDLPEGVTAAERGAIQAVIANQIRAFQRDDGAGAFALASPSIQSQFQTPEAFMRMVRDSYQPVYRPRKYQFLELRIVDGYLVQKLALIGPDGLAVIAMYPMVKLKSGDWRTDGCYLMPIASQGA